MILFTTTLRREIFSKKSVFVIIFFIASSYIVGKYSTSMNTLMRGDSQLIDTLFVVYTLFGYLFSSVLFSGLIAGEIESQTMRFLTPYISRSKIFLSKYFASICYFLILTALSLALLFLSRGVIAIPVHSLLFIIGFYLYVQSLTMLISVMSNSERLSSLINLMLSILLPIFYTVSLLKKWFIFEVLQWLFPYHYLSKTWELVILYVLSILLIIIGQFIFSKKEI